MEKKEERTSTEAMLTGIAADVAQILKYTKFLAAVVGGLIGLWVVSILLTVVANS